MEISKHQYFNCHQYNCKPHFGAKLNIDKNALKTAQETFNEMAKWRNKGTPLSQKVITFFKGIGSAYKEHGFDGVKLLWAEAFEKPTSAKSSFSILKHDFESKTSEIPGTVTIITREKRNLLPGQHSDLTYKIDSQPPFTYKVKTINAFGENIDYPMPSGWEAAEAPFSTQTPNVLPANIHPLNIKYTQEQLLNEVADLTRNDSRISPFDKVKEWNL